MAYRWRKVFKLSVIRIDDVRIAARRPEFVQSITKSLYKETYETYERVLLRAAVVPGDRVLEIGAGIGLTGLLAARLAGPAGSVVSYEANPALKDVIQDNYALNADAPRPELRMKMITADGDSKPFHVAENLLSSSLYQRFDAVAGAQTAIEVPSQTFADALAEVRPDILAMDVEGAEADLLTSPVPEGVRAMVVELHPHVIGAERTEALLASLTAQGFTMEMRMRKNVLLRRQE
ncbi:MAG: FkbM family methyltransferase [Pseudomonadota bacterium]